MTQNEHISWSQIFMSLQCAHRRYLRYVMGFKIPGKRHMKESTAVHHTAEHDLRAKMETGSLLEEDVITDMARDKLNVEWDEGELSLSKDEETVGKEALRGQSIDSAVSFARLHHHVLAPQIQPTAVEREFSLTIGDTGYDLIGRIDVEEEQGEGVTRSITVSDLKTTKLHKKEIIGIDAAQLSVYALAINAHTDIIPSLGLHVIRRPSPKGQRGAEAYILRSIQTPEGLDRTAAAIGAVLDSIKRGDHMPAPPGSWYCSDYECGFWRDKCKVRF